MGIYEYPGAIQDKVTPDIDFTEDVVVQCYVPGENYQWS